MERAFLSRLLREEFNSTASVFNEQVILCTSSDCTVVTFVSDKKIPHVLIATEPGLFQMDEFESDSDSDYDERESEEIAEHSNAITRSGRRIKASADTNRWSRRLIRSAVTDVM